MIPTLLVKFWRPLLALVLATGVGLWIFTLRHELGTANARSAALQGAVDSFRDAQTLNLRTIASLRRSAEAWRQSMETEKMVAAQAVEDVRKAREDLDKVGVRLKAALKGDVTRPACASLIGVDLGQTCPAYAARVRELAR